MKLIGAVVGIAAMCAAQAVAQQTAKTTTKEQTKIEVQDGKDVRVTGCLERNPGGGYMVTNLNGGMKYALVTNDDLAKRLGQWVEVKGIATDRGDAKMKIESTVGTSGEVAGGKVGDSRVKTTTKVEGDLGVRFLGVKSLKKLADSCR